MKHLRKFVKEACGITYGGSAPGIESMVRSVARCLIASLSREDLASLAGGVVPASIGHDDVAAEMANPSALSVRPLRNCTEKYRASGRGGDLWMRENKAAVNAAVAQLQSASAGSPQAPLKGRLLEPAKKRVGWSIFRTLPKEEQESWIEDAVSERTLLGFKQRWCPKPAPRGARGKGSL